MERKQNILNIHMKKYSLRILISILIIFVLSLATGIFSQAANSYYIGKRENKLEAFNNNYERKRVIISDAIYYFNDLYDIVGRVQNYASIKELVFDTPSGYRIPPEWGTIPLWLEQRYLDEMMDTISRSDEDGTLIEGSWQYIVWQERRIIKPISEKLLIEEFVHDESDSSEVQQAKLNLYFSLAFYISDSEYHKAAAQDHSSITEDYGAFDREILGSDGKGGYTPIIAGKEVLKADIAEIYYNSGIISREQQAVDITKTFLYTREVFYEFAEKMYNEYLERIKIRYYIRPAHQSEAAGTIYAGMNDEALSDNLSTIGGLFTRTGNNLLIAMNGHFELFSDHVVTLESAGRKILNRELKANKTLVMVITLSTMFINFLVLLYMTRIMMRYYNGLYRAQENFKASYEYHKYISKHDMLTNLMNKNYLKEKFDSIIYGPDVEPKLALIFIDIDNFKEINDIMGHNVGDILLSKTAAILKEICKNCEVVGRVGGDEFVVLSRYNDVAEVEALGKTLTECIQKPFNLMNLKYSITASVGAALYPENGWDFQEVYKNADTAMYESKQRGRNRFTMFSPDMRKEILNTYDTLKYLRKFEDYLYLEYQPIVSLDNGHIAGFEALSRMKVQDHFIPPAEFVPLAVEHGMIIKMGYFTLNKVCAFIADMTKRDIEIGCINVNISAGQLYDEGFTDKLGDIIKKYGIKTKNLMLELTEDVVINYNKSSSIIDKIVSMGVRVGIDDFGTGYSSLSYLSMLPLKFIKIDKDFSNNSSHEKKEKIVEAIVNLANSFGISTCAEGIETAKYLDFLKKAGCMLGQGFLFSRSVSGEYIAENAAKLADSIKHIVENGDAEADADFDDRRLFET